MSKCFLKLIGLTPVLVFIASCRNNELDRKKMFEQNISFYYDKPVKNLILDAKYKLKNYTFAEADSYFYLDGLYLTFTNDVKIFVEIKKFEFQSKKREGDFWDINKCILEDASEIRLLTDLPLNNGGVKQNVTIEFIAKDSIIIRDDFYDAYREKSARVSDDLFR